MTERAANYWNQGIDNVPWMTGASTLMDGADIREHSERLGIALPITTSLLDVGCGTGRVAQFVTGEYLGVDISVDAVAYCQRAGLNVLFLSGQRGIGRLSFNADWIFCLSVFTHIDRAERQEYLSWFAQHASNLLVDVIPGDGAGDVALWTTDWLLFKDDLVAADWEIAEYYDRQGPSGPVHRYVRAHRVL